MSLTDTQRGELRRLVDRLRDDLLKDLSDVLQSELGVDPDGGVKPESSLSADHPDHTRRIETRRLLLRLLNVPDEGAAASDARRERVEAHLRGLAFTHLHRFVAFKMMEAPERKVYAREVVGPKRETGEILLWIADQPDEVDARWSSAKPEVREAIYLDFLRSLCVDRYRELGALFDPDDLASRIFPRRWRDLLDAINNPDFAAFWNEDETLGWVYQYYTPKAQRDLARKRSAAPQNAWEMAFRNQFYTPDYVVRFLVDNTLGRLWLEMFPGSVLQGECKRLLVAPGEVLPARTIRDPRTLKVLDPACGSGHFLLAAFDLLVQIYKDAWRHPELGPKLHADFAGDQDRFDALIPKMIVELNLHGIDIDRRAVQIASLALWLKAQRKLPEKARKKPPIIERSGIVLAEPLAGDVGEFGAFRQEVSLRNPVAARLLDGARDVLKLAGELGSLLRVDEDLPAMVQAQRTKEELLRREGGVQRSLFGEAVPEEQLWLEYKDARADVAFWHKQEGVLRAELAAHGQHAGGFEGAAQRLFAKDGAGVLRFLDALGATYDVVLMNPPFGAATPAGKGYVQKRYENSRQDLFACFVERGMQLAPDGFVGVLSTDAGFFRRGLENWRREVILKKGTLETMVHLGGHVLDATVKVACYVIRSGLITTREARYLRVLGKTNRLARLDAASQAVRAGQRDEAVTQVAQSAFKKLPYASFGYWCSETVRGAFESVVLDPTAGSDRAVVPDGSYVRARLGGHTADDFRWLRLRWEIPEGKVNRWGWLSFAKGGDYSPFHDDLHLVVCWDESVPTYFGFVGRPGRSGVIPEAVSWYGRPGLTYPLRTTRPFAPRVLPAGSVFGHKGPGVFEVGPIGPLASPLPSSDSVTLTRLHECRIFALIGLLNARPFQYLLSLGTGMSESEGGTSSNSYEVGLLQRMPLPSTVLADEALAAAAFSAWSARVTLDAWDETTTAFILPFPVPEPRSLAALVHERIRLATDDALGYARALATIEARALAHYGFDAVVAAEIERNVGALHALAVPDEKKLTRQLAIDLLSWAFGVAMGRFDVRLATGERPWPALPEPFAPVAGRSPGMVPAGTAPDPGLVDADGVLVDDPRHPDDVVTRVRAVLERVWGEHAGSLERELIAALKLDVKEGLRGWFTKVTPGGFWEEHRRRYSKSKREAPLYVPLRSPDGHWLCWVAWHRLTAQTLYAVVGERYIAGWRQALEAELATSQKRADAGAKLTAADREARDATKQRFADLGAFEQRVRSAMSMTVPPAKAAVTFEPQHDDGVLVSLAPLHALVPWPPKTKQGTAKSRLEEVWRALAARKLDWSRTAMRYWPTQVKRRCETDLSLAIAHGLDGAGTRWDGWRLRLRAGEALADEAGVEAADGDEDEDEGDEDET